MVVGNGRQNISNLGAWRGDPAELKLSPQRRGPFPTGARVSVPGGGTHSVGWDFEGGIANQVVLVFLRVFNECVPKFLGKAETWIQLVLLD